MITLEAVAVLQLLRIVRENTVVIVVGETGSGKTTQLTQVSVLSTVFYYCCYWYYGTNIMF